VEIKTEIYFIHSRSQFIFSIISYWLYFLVIFICFFWHFHLTFLEFNNTIRTNSQCATQLLLFTTCTL